MDEINNLKSGFEFLEEQEEELGEDFSSEKQQITEQIYFIIYGN